MDPFPATPRSGGKMLRPRRSAVPRTPYDRPPPQLSPNSYLQNPNWLSRFATGAGRVLASVFGPEPSSSSSSSGGESNSDGFSGDNEDISSQSGELMEKKTSEAVEWKSEAKRLIAQLLMHETFSREEFDRLADIIKSRIVDSPVNEGTEDSRLILMGDRTVRNDIDGPDLRETAIAEAKKWLEEKRVDSNPKSELEYGTCTLNTAMPHHVIEGEVSSPVDVAKSYMQARPPWASPSMNHIQLKSPSPPGIQLFKEATPRLSGSVSVSKLMSPAIGSWNIQEELRKVRSRATEEMLRTRTSSKIDWTALSSNHDVRLPLFAADKVEATTQDRIFNPAQLIDVPLNWSGSMTIHGVTDSQVLQNGLQKNAIPSDSAISIPEQSQDLGSMPIIEGRRAEGVLNCGQQLQLSEDAIAVSQSATAGDDGQKENDKNSQPLSSLVGIATEDAIPDTRLLEMNCSMSKKAAGESSAAAANGFPSPGLSLSAGHEREKKSNPSNEETNQDKMARRIPGEDTCQLLSEAHMEVPVTKENDDAGVVSRSQDSSSTHHEGLSQDLTRPSNTKRSLEGNSGIVVEKQQGRKVSRYNRKGRGRGKY